MQIIHNKILIRFLVIWLLIVVEITFSYPFNHHQTQISMTFIDYAQKIETLKALARHKQSGTPEQLAKKFQVSERTIQRMVQGLRDHGYPITFNRFRKTYES